MQIVILSQTFFIQLNDSFDPFQRLRLRGDWSDTGPNARPEGNQQSNPLSNDGETAADTESQEASTSQNQSMVSKEYHQETLFIIRQMKIFNGDIRTFILSHPIFKC